MHDPLKKDQKKIKDLLEKTVNESLAYLNSLEDGFVAPEYKAGKPVSLPENGLGAEQSIDLFNQKYQEYLIKSAGPNYFGYVVGGATPASIVGDWLTSVFDQMALGLYENVDYHIEEETIKLLRELLNLPDSFFGTFVTGATMSNFVNLAIARQWAAHQCGVNVGEEGLYGLDDIKVLSASPHSSIYKSLSMLGMGRRSLINIDCLPGREAMDVENLQVVLKENQGDTCIVVANAGTVNTTDFDDLSALVELKKKYYFWLHVDAAFAGIAACSEKYKSLLTGIDGADSITIDAHKWLNVPYDSAIQFTKHRRLQNEVFYNGAAYLGPVKADENPALFNLTPENSRRLRALPVWFTLMAYGKKGYQDIVERNCRIAREFSRRIEESSFFKLLAPTRLNVVCFTLNMGENELISEVIHKFLDELKQTGKTFLTPTIYQGKPAMRIAVSNWRTTEEDADKIWSEMIKIARYFVN